MRPLVLLLCMLSPSLIAGEGGTATSSSAQERKSHLAAQASAAAAAMGREENYIEFLQPVPDRVLIVQDMRAYVVFGEGWSRREKWGVWSLDERSVIYLRLSPESEATELYIDGRYHNGAESTRVLLNEVALSEAPLQGLTIKLPGDLAAGGTVKIELQHIDPRSPNELNPAVGDRRRMKFGLERLQLRQKAQ